MTEALANNYTDETELHTEDAIHVAPSSINGDPPSSDKATITKLSAQLKRLNDANGKYKNLLKLAKDRIEKQEEETKLLKEDVSQLLERIQEYEEKEALWTLNSAGVKFLTGNALTNDESGDKNNNSALQSTLGVESRIVRICQRTKNNLNDGDFEVWALVEMQSIVDDGSNCRRYKEWRRFDTESQLQDFIRLETGEPIVLPPYMLSQEQSKQIQEQAEQQILKVNDEFRRFRVKAELARKQSESLIRELQASLTQKVTERIENSNNDPIKTSFISGDLTESQQLRTLLNQLELMKKEMTTKESKWRQSYEALLSENNFLKSSESQSSSADQWRRRYEECLKEKDDLEKRVKLSNPMIHTDDEYEAKYRDLKESFRLYRKKAKEIFEAQLQSSGGGGPPLVASGIASNSSADAKLSYLKNLMMNYFTAEPSVRDHMLQAIGTVLQFTPEEQKRIVAKKATQDSTSWF